VIVSTASPSKFPEALRACNVEPLACPAVEQLFQKKTRFEGMEKNENWTEKLKKILDEITKKRQKTL